jgi:hypothetical protein
MAELTPNHRFQFSLKSLLIAITAIFVGLPLLPFLLVFALWYVLDPVGLPADIILWVGNRLDPRRTRKRRSKSTAPKIP